MKRSIIILSGFFAVVMIVATGVWFIQFKDEQTGTLLIEETSGEQKETPFSGQEQATPSVDEQTGVLLIQETPEGQKDPQFSGQGQATPSAQKTGLPGQADPSNSLPKKTLPVVKETPIPENRLSNLEYVDAVFTDIPHDFELSLSIVEKKDKYFEGDVISFVFCSSQTSHIAILNHQVDGTIVVLFPNAWDQETLVQANVTYYIPNREKGHDYPITVAPPFGRDVVQLVGCTEASEFHRLIEEVSDKTRSNVPFTTIEHHTVTRGVKRAIQKRSSSLDDSVQWSEAHIFVPTYPKQD